MIVQSNIDIDPIRTYSPFSSLNCFQKEGMIDEKDFLQFLTIKQGISDNSIRHCMIRIRIINNWLHSNELTKESIERFFMQLKNKGLKNNSLNTYKFVLGQLVEYCKDRELPSSFLDGFKSFKKTSPDIIIFTQEEIEKIINTPLVYGRRAGIDCSFLDFRYRTLTMFLAYTGCRFSEVANLKIKNIDWDGKARINETKTNENRIVYFSEPLIGRFKELCKKKGVNDFVFQNSKGNKINPQDYSTDLKKRAIAANITKRVFPHNFRHSWATHMLEAGVPETQVATLGGWKDIQTLYSTYMHLADKTLQKAAMRHPMVRMGADPITILKNTKEDIEKLHLEMDERFEYSLLDKGSEINLTIRVKQL